MTLDLRRTLGVDTCQICSMYMYILRCICTTLAHTFVATQQLDCVTLSILTYYSPVVLCSI